MKGDMEELGSRLLSRQSSFTLFNSMESTKSEEFCRILFSEIFIFKITINNIPQILIEVLHFNWHYQLTEFSNFYQ